MAKIEAPKKTPGINPFSSREKTRENSLEFIVKQAKQINDGLAEGVRVFHKVPVGNADEIARLLNEAGGWTAAVKTRDEEFAVLVIGDAPPEK